MREKKRNAQTFSIGNSPLENALCICNQVDNRSLYLNAPTIPLSTISLILHKCVIKIKALPPIRHVLTHARNK